MLFNSLEFIFLFLPATLFFYYTLLRYGNGSIACLFLLCSSLIFYGYWNPKYLYLIIGSIVLNYCCGRLIISKKVHENLLIQRFLLASGIIFNISAIGYFKYANFLVENINKVGGFSFTLEKIVLPLAISFFTFQQIAFLIDSYRGIVKEYNFFNYALFVTFFPQLIAGPIVHQKEMMPQFAKRLRGQISNSFIATGITLFAFGLFKKVMIADSFSPVAQDAFLLASSGELVNCLYAWKGALAYTFQLYFDFSGYSDMAMGLGFLFGIKLPLNFNSPYQALSIVDFWRRWHITLSRFLKDYLYIPLGGNRKGKIILARNLFITMLIGGLWHGAGWTFVIWGGLHGIYLVVNHIWSKATGKFSFDKFLFREFFWCITFLAVVAAWVVFRAENLNTAISFLKSMFGINGVILRDLWLMKLGAVGDLIISNGFISTASDIGVSKTDFFIFLAFIIGVKILPNSQQIACSFTHLLIDDQEQIENNKSKIKILWRPNTTWAFIVAILTFISVINLTKVSEFLYFQF
jgi:D-alanyl-lipoteichoic acid acyltransferase DltB (MBOAT superfamily)